MACVSKNLTPQYGTEENGSPFVSADSIAAIFHIYLCLQFGRIFNTKALIMDYRNLIPFHGVCRSENMLYVESTSYKRPTAANCP